jgi:hypothetical protein
LSGRHIGIEADRGQHVACHGGWEFGIHQCPGGWMEHRGIIQVCLECRVQPTDDMALVQRHDPIHGDVLA